MRSLKDNLLGVIDLGVVIMIGVTFAGIMMMAYIIWQIRYQILSVPAAGGGGRTASYNLTNRTMTNITNGFSNAVNLILVSITILILAIAISALLMLRGRNQ